MPMRIGQEVRQQPFAQQRWHVPGWTWLLAVCVAMLTLVILFPANWVAYWVAQKSEGQLILADANGTLWHGSAVLSLANGHADAASSVSSPSSLTGFSLPGRLEWQLQWPQGLALPLLLNHDTVLQRPLQLMLKPDRIEIEDGVLNLPLALGSLIGAPLNTLRLQGSARLQWPRLSLLFSGKSVISPASGSVRLIEVSSAINAAIAGVRPLGTYRLDWTSAEAGMQLHLQTEQGPLQLQGDGAWTTSTGVRFAGHASIAPGTPPQIAQRLQPLLNVLGRRNDPAGNPPGFAPGSNNEVMIRIGS